MFDRIHKNNNMVAVQAAFTNSGLHLQDNRPKMIAQRKAQGVGATEVVQLASSVRLDTAAFDLGNGEKELVGKHMEAHLEQGSQMKGSAPGDGVQSLLMNALKAHGYKRMIRGHLLNGQLGGLGVAANLFPITSAANSKHKMHVENPIKDQITKGKDVNYSVTVNSADSVANPAASFVCHAETTDHTWAHDETINSDPSKTTVSNSAAEGSIVNNTAGISFSSKNLPAGWGEKDKGYRGHAAHQATVNKYDVSFNGKKNEIDSKLYAEGVHFNKGVIDRHGYANELLGEYAADAANKWPLYFNSVAYHNEQQVEAMLDHANDAAIESVITKLEALL